MAVGRDPVPEKGRLRLVNQNPHSFRLSLSARPHPLRGAPVQAGAGVHRSRRSHARPRHRWHDRDFHAHRRGDAQIAAGQRPLTPLPHRHRRQLLCAGRAAGRVGLLFVSALPVARVAGARIRGSDRIPRRIDAAQRSARRRGGASPARRVRHGQLFLRVRHQRARGARLRAVRRHAFVAAGRGDESPHVAEHVRRRSVDHQRHHRRRTPVRSSA